MTRIVPGKLLRTVHRIYDYDKTGVALYDTFIAAGGKNRFDFLLRKTATTPGSLRFVLHSDVLLCLATIRKNSYVLVTRTQQMGWVSHAGLTLLE